jgi:cell division protein FtsL
VGEYPTYNWGTSAPKRDAYTPTRQSTQRYPRVTTNPRPRAAQAPKSALTLALKVAAVVCVLFVAIGVCRVTLTSASVATALEVDQLATSIDSARVSGKALEVEQSTLANPTRIKSEAAALGMVAGQYTSVIDISGDVVALDAAGNLSISESINLALQN